jgi:isopentenyl-diphosphate delta-isomerase
MVSEIENIVLVDEHNAELGVMEKMQVHKEGLLHRAISVFVFNSKGEMLLQKRSAAKYHSAGLWTNTCCSHPRPGESLENAANRRLFEEMGMRCKLTGQFSFIYKVNLENGLKEHELDYVYTGISDQIPILNQEEASSWKYEGLHQIQIDIEANPQNYTAWFKIVFNKVISDRK